MRCWEEAAGPGLVGRGAAGFLWSWREIPGISGALFVVEAASIYFIVLFLHIVYSQLQWCRPRRGQRALGACSGRAAEGLVTWVAAGERGRSAANLPLPFMV